jgi:hypothetical protein
MFVAKLVTVAGLLLVTVVAAGLGLWTYQAFAPASTAVAADGPGVTDDLLAMTDGGLADLVEQRVRDWQPTREERRFDEIGWAPSLGEARRLAAKHKQPIFLLVTGPAIATGRCLASAFNIRSGGLSNDNVIELLNRAFVPVYISGPIPAVDRAEVERIRAEAAALKLPRGGQAWALSPEGRVVNGLDACHAPPHLLLNFLGEVLETLALEQPAAPPVTPPARQSGPPTANRDALVLHLTARYLERKGEELVPMRAPLGKDANYFMRGCPAEDWIVLERSEWTRLLPSGTVRIGQSWELDGEVAARLFRHMYPPTEDNDVAANRIDEGKLTATVVALDGGAARARLEGTLRMKHRFDPQKEDDRFVNAPLLGFVDFVPGRPGVRALRLTSSEATYGKNPFGIALRSVAR